MYCDNCGSQNAASVLYCDSCGVRRYKAKIRIVDQNGVDKTLHLFDQDHFVGRSKTCDIFLDDVGASRRHARIYHENNGFFVEDLESKNGILLNGDKKTKAQLSNYDCIQIGETSLHFYLSNNNATEAINNSEVEGGEGTLEKIAREMQSNSILNDFLNIVIDSVVILTYAKIVSVWSYGENGRLKLMADKNLSQISPGDMALEKAQKLADKVADNGRIFVILKNKKQSFVPDLRVFKGSAFLMLGIPLRYTEEDKTTAHGVLLIQAQPQCKVMDKVFIDDLEELIARTVVGLRNSSLYKQMEKNTSNKPEKILIKELQNCQQPVELPKSEAYEFANYSRSRNTIGGDFFDFHQRDKEHMVFAIGQISGTDLSTSLLFSNLQPSLQLLSRFMTSPTKIIQRMSTYFGETGSETLKATFFLCFYNFRVGTLTFANAGHYAPLLFRRNGKLEKLKASGQISKNIEKRSVVEDSVSLGAGDILIFYSRGLVEAQSEAGKKLGLRLITNAVEGLQIERPKATADEILKFILRIVDNHIEKEPQKGDFTVMVLRRTSKTGIIQKAMHVQSTRL